MTIQEFIHHPFSREAANAVGTLVIIAFVLLYAYGICEAYVKHRRKKRAP